MTRAALAPSPPHSAPRKDEYYSEWMMWWELEARWEYGWDHENRLIKVVHWKTYNDTGMLYLRPYKRVEFYYCPACGGNRTQKVVHMNDNWSVEDTPDWTLTKWLRYETLGLGQLRVDEKYDADENGLDEADPFRTERVTYDAPSGIGYIMKETLYTYSTPYTASNPSKEDIWYHYDRMGVVSALTSYSGALVSGQHFQAEAFAQFAGSTENTTRRIAAKEYDLDVELYYFNARWYSPVAGRFVSKDPLPYSEIDTPGHAYEYALSNPVCYIDVNGLYLQGYPTPERTGPPQPNPGVVFPPIPPTPTPTPTARPTPTPTPEGPQPTPSLPVGTPTFPPRALTSKDRCELQGGKWTTITDHWFGGDLDRCIGYYGGTRVGKDVSVR